jgi:hypothetical protein
MSLRELPTGIWVLGVGSLFMNIASEMVHSLLPIFMITVLGVSVVTVGIVEGIAEATATIIKVFSGAFSDYLGKRKIPLVFGYALAVATKPIFPLANSIGWVFGARLIDRIGKGIRLSIWYRFQPNPPPYTIARRIGTVSCCRPRIGSRCIAVVGIRRCCAVGIAHGMYARSIGKARR